MAEDERKSSAPDQSTTARKRENALTDSSLFLSFPFLKLSFCFPACHSRGRKFRERERERFSLPRDGWKIKCTAMLRENTTVNRIFPSVLVSSLESKFVWEAREGVVKSSRESESGIGLLLSFFLFGKF